MLAYFRRKDLDRLPPNAVSDSLEQGRVAYFPECPFPLPSEEDLDFLRQEMPKRLKLKNISYYLASDALYGIRADARTAERAAAILREHNRRVQTFLVQYAPSLACGWTPGTCSVRPMQEKGRHLSAHASNELVHVDARAFAATHGDRILRFFVNINPAEDRVWITKGAFPELYRRHAQAAGIAKARLKAGPLGRLYSGALKTLSRAGIPAARQLDTSPYDRAMRRFHNYMKDTPAFQESREGHQEFAFKPFSAWAVFTDMVSHACVSGQHALVDTFVVPLKNCRRQELAPFNILNAS